MTVVREAARGATPASRNLPQPGARDKAIAHARGRRPRRRRSAGCIIGPCSSRSTSATPTSSCGLFRHGSLVATRRARTSPAATADELELLLDGLLGLDRTGLDEIAAIACASVVPTLTSGLEVVCAGRGISLLVAGAGHVPMAIRVERPAEVGADRLVNALAAARLYGTPAVVVDLGHRDDLRRRGSGRGVRRGGDRARARAGARCARRTDRQAAPDRAPGTGPGDRARHRQRDAGRHGPRLPGAGQRPARPDPGRARGHVRRRRSATSGRSSPAACRPDRGLAGSSGSTRSIRTLTLKGLAILHAEVSGGEPLQAGLA